MDGNGLLKRLDKLVEELQLIRREVADMMVRQADSESVRADCATPSHEGGRDRAPITCISSLEELFELDFENPNKEVVNDEEASADALIVPDNASVDELFVATGSEEAMEQLFVERRYFNLLDTLSIADRYLFANELFMGDQASLMDMLAEIELLSDMGHVESYLYDVRQFGREEDVVKHLVAFIREHSC